MIVIKWILKKITVSSFGSRGSLFKLDLRWDVFSVLLLLRNLLIYLNILCEYFYLHSNCTLSPVFISFHLAVSQWKCISIGFIETKMYLYSLNFHSVALTPFELIFRQVSTETVKKEQITHSISLQSKLIMGSDHVLVLRPLKGNKQPYFVPKIEHVPWGWFSKIK